MAQEVHSREQSRTTGEFLQAIHKDQRLQIADEIANNEAFRQIQKRGKGSRDIENLYRGSLSSLSRFSPNDDQSSDPEPVQLAQRVDLATIQAKERNDRTAKTVVIHPRGGTGKSTYQ